MNRCFLIVLSLFFFAAVDPAAAEQTVTQIQSLSFGSFAVHADPKRDKAVPYTVIVAPDDTVTYNGLVAGPVSAHRGEYLLEGYPPNAALLVTVTNGVLSDGAGEKFSVVDYTNNEPVTDDAGTAMLYIGATLRTSGRNNAYNSGGYDGTVDMVIEVQ